MFKIDSVTAINTIRDSLRDNLVDPYETAGGSRESNMYIFSNEPHSTFKYPQIELLKIDNPSSPISIGSNYWEQEEVIINIWFYTKNGFKITPASTEYQNAQLVEYYLGQIKETLKENFNTLSDAGVKGYKHINTTKVDYDKDTQLYFGACTIRVRFFKQ